MNAALLTFVLFSPLIVLAIKCPIGYYPNPDALPTPGPSANCEFFSNFCTRKIITKNTTFHQFQQSKETTLVPGVYYDCSEAEPTNFDGDGVSIHHCNTDDCTAARNFTNLIQCGDLVTSDPTELPSRTVHCGPSGTCFKAIASKPGQIQIGNKVFTYLTGATYGCGENKCPITENGDGIQISCCNTNGCNFQAPPQNSAKSSLALSVALIAVVSRWLH